MSTDENEHQEALGRVFFQGNAEEYLENLKLKMAERLAREDIRDATGITDEAVLAEMAGLGIRVETLSALTLIPLIDVAWADGKMDERERKAVLEGAVATGIPLGSTSYKLLEIWTEDAPPPDLVNAWHGYTREFCKQLTAEETERMEANILGRARDVALAAGDVLDRAPHISGEEDACLSALAAAFKPAG